MSAPEFAALVLFVVFVSIIGDTVGELIAECPTLVNREGSVITVDPFIIPSLNETNGSLPPGVCGFSEYPLVPAKCKDTLVFVIRSIPAGIRAHGVYLLEDSFVDQKTARYRCPSPATDIDLRNGTGGGWSDPGRCRAQSITQVLVDGTRNLTAPFVASSECSGYIAVDELDVFVPNTTAGCSTSSVVSSKCYTRTIVRVPLSKYVKPSRVALNKVLVFACPSISGNQPGRMASHCSDGMALAVNVTCKPKTGGVIGGEPGGRR